MIGNTLDPKAIIGFQGIDGAYSHLACKSTFAHHKTIGYPTFKQAFEAIESSKVALGVIPIENNLGGRVSDIHHLLPQSKLFVVGEHYEPIKHCLLAIKGTVLEDIKQVYSHEQALSQCTNLINRHNFTPIKYYDTAGSALMIAQKNDKNRACIASKLACEIYGLDILEDQIADDPRNTTRFVLLQNKPMHYPYSPQITFKTSCIFQTRDIPSALYKALGGFATNGINITKLESYRRINDGHISNFYIEFLGHEDQDACVLALEELRFFSANVHLLGTYPTCPNPT